MNYGYAIVSTDDQNADLQKVALRKAGCKKILTDDGLSGVTTKRPAPAPLSQSLEARRFLWSER